MTNTSSSFLQERLSIKCLFFRSFSIEFSTNHHGICQTSMESISCLNDALMINELPLTKGDTWFCICGFCICLHSLQAPICVPFHYSSVVFSPCLLQNNAS